MHTAAKLKPLYKRIQQEVFTHLPADLHYHRKEHTEIVMRNALLLSKAAKLSQREEEMLYAAAILHDTGYGKKYNSNEGVAAILAQNILPQYGFSQPEVEAIKNMILATNLIIEPSSKLEMLMADADMGYLGQPDFLKWSNRLLEEWRLHKMFTKSNHEWLELQRQFLAGYTFFTAEGTALFDSGKQKNLETLNKLVEWPY